MFVKLSSDVVINPNYITAIEPSERDIVNGNGKSVKYTLYMVDGQQWYLAEEDYCELRRRIWIV